MNTVQTRAQTLAGEECHLQKIKEFDKMELQLKIGQQCQEFLRLKKIWNIYF